MKKKLRFVINPAAGSRKKEHLSAWIQRYLDHSAFEYDLFYTQAPKHATTLAKEAACLGYHAIVAVGGDGTVNEVAKALIGTPSHLAIIPMGSANGLARELDISLNPIKAIQLLNQWHMHSIDTITVGQECCLSTAGIGFDAHVAANFLRSRKRGFLAYLRVIFKEFSKYPFQNYTLIADGKEIHTNAFLISIVNTSQYGSCAYIAPKASLTDGYLDITILKKFPSHAVPYLVYRLFKGTFDCSPYVDTLQAKEVKIKKEHILVHLDGEPFEFQYSLQMKINPLSLKVLVPAYFIPK